MINVRDGKSTIGSEFDGREYTDIYYCQKADSEKASTYTNSQSHFQDKADFHY